MLLFIAAWASVLTYYGRTIHSVLPPVETTSVAPSEPTPRFVAGGSVETIFDWALASPDWAKVYRPVKKPTGKEKSLVILNGAKR